MSETNRNTTSVRNGLLTALAVVIGIVLVALLAVLVALFWVSLSKQKKANVRKWLNKRYEQVTTTWKTVSGVLEPLFGIGLQGGLFAVVLSYLKNRRNTATTSETSTDTQTDTNAANNGFSFDWSVLQSLATILTNLLITRNQKVSFDDLKTGNYNASGFGGVDGDGEFKGFGGDTAFGFDTFRDSVFGKSVSDAAEQNRDQFYALGLQFLFSVIDNVLKRLGILFVDAHIIVGSEDGFDRVGGHYVREEGGSFTSESLHVKTE